MDNVIAKARLAACKRWPYTASAILSMIPVEKQGFDRVEADRHWRLYYGAEHFASLTFEQQQTEILRCLSRLLRRHYKRFENLVGFCTNDRPDAVPVETRQSWYLATELEINDDLEVEGFEFAVDPDLPEVFGFDNGQTAESYYSLLNKPPEEKEEEQEQEQEKPEEQKDDNQKPGDAPKEDEDKENSEEPSKNDQEETSEQEDEQAGDSEGDKDSTDTEDESEQASEEPGEEEPSNEESESGSDSDSEDPAGGEDAADSGDGEGDDESGESESSNGSGEAGEDGEPADEFGSSACDGVPRSWENPLPGESGNDPQNDSVLEPADGIPESEQAHLLDQVAEKILASDGKGSVPGFLTRWAKDLKTPRIDYARLLRNQIQFAVEHTTGAADYTFRKLPRRDFGLDKRFSIPALHAPNPRVTVIIDTSGSVRTAELTLFLTELGGVLKGLQRRDGISVLCADAQVQSVSKITKVADLKVRGGGGTDMSLAIEEAAKAKPRPQLILVFTDGLTGWPEHSVGVKTFAILSREPKNQFKVPDWIKTVVLDLKDGR